MAENVTRPIKADIDVFLSSVELAGRREDTQLLLPLFCRWTGMKPILWTDGLAGKSGNGIVGFGHYHYRYASGREGDWFLTGFSPRKQNLVIYIMPGFKGHEKTLSQLGPHKHSVSCLYLGRLAKNNLDALESLVRKSIDEMKEKYDWRTS
ncbi:MAG: DUF1801 domain-containing protein [Rhizobiaceae bacterium]